MGEAVATYEEEEEDEEYYASSGEWFESKAFIIFIVIKIHKYSKLKSTSAEFKKSIYNQNNS